MRFFSPLLISGFHITASLVGEVLYIGTHPGLGTGKDTYTDANTCSLSRSHSHQLGVWRGRIQTAGGGEHYKYIPENAAAQTLLHKGLKTMASTRPVPGPRHVSWCQKQTQEVLLGFGSVRPNTGRADEQPNR